MIEIKHCQIPIITKDNDDEDNDTDGPHQN